jgi:hypothetical protein
VGADGGHVQGRVQTRAASLAGDRHPRDAARACRGEASGRDGIHAAAEEWESVRRGIIMHHDGWRIPVFTPYTFHSLGAAATSGFVAAEDLPVLGAAGGSC